jgi:amino acid transporter
MYYHHQDSFGGELLGIGLVLLLIAAFCLVKVTLFVIRTFVKYYDHRSLWISLVICIVLSLVGILLATQVDQSYSFLPVVGLAILLITCAAVSLRSRDTFLREKVNLIDEVLHTSWWGSEDTPRVEQEQAQVAA